MRRGMTTHTVTRKERGARTEPSRQAGAAPVGRDAATAGRPARVGATGARRRGSDADSLGLFLRDLDHHPLPDHAAQTELAKRVAAGDGAGRRERVAATPALGG